MTQDKSNDPTAGKDKIHGGSGRGDNKGDRTDDKGASDDRGGTRGVAPEAETTDGGSRTEGQGGKASSGNKTPGGGGSKR